MIVTFIRHGQIPANIDRRYAGRTDQLLTEEGKRQAAAVEAPEVDRVFTSPYTRCLQTAEIIFPDMDAEVVDDLREMDFGIFENRTADEMVDFAPYREWVDGMCLGPVPEGESMDEFGARCTAAFARIVEDCRDDERLAIVAHGGTVMAIMGAYNDEGREYFEYHIENCQQIVCEVERAPEGITLHRIGGVELGGSLPPKVEDTTIEDLV